MDTLPSKNRFVFSTNCSDPVLDKSNPFPELIEAVLLSQKYTSASALAIMKSMKLTGSLLISDNGNFSRMSKIAASFAVAGEAIQTEARMQVAKLGAVQKDVLKRRDVLIHEIVESGRKETGITTSVKITSDQLLSNPDYLIGPENFTIPVMSMTGLLSPLMGLRPRSIKKYQTATLKAYLDQKAGHYGNVDRLAGVRKYAVLHSYDYESARQGARVLSSEEVEGIAVGFGGPMASRNYIQEIAIRGRTFTFETGLPEAYLLATAIIAGVMDGLEGQTKPIHILGLGSPILIAILSYLLRTSNSISIDATSTFKDAMEGTIYGDKEALLKLDMFKVAAFALRDDVPYSSSSPYFQQFEKRFPSDWTELQKRLLVNSGSNISDLSVKLKSNPGLLETYAPYFSPMRKGSDSMLTALRMARSGSNYWLLQRLCEDVRSKIDNETEISAWMHTEVGRYVSVASPKWALAVNKLLEIIDKLAI